MKSCDGYLVSGLCCLVHRQGMDEGTESKMHEDVIWLMQKWLIARRDDLCKKKYSSLDRSRKLLTS